MKSTLLKSLLLLSFFVISCSKGKDAAPVSAQELYKTDRVTLTQMSSSGPSLVDEAFKNNFTNIFGGQTGNDISAYLDLRLKHVWNEAEFQNASVTPELPEVKGMGSGGHDPQPTNKDVETIAMNVGTAIWLDGKVGGAEETVVKGSESIAIDSARAGLILLGTAYRSAVASDGQIVAIPPEYRITVLVHEARHSDCTGGFSADYVTKIKAADNLDDFLVSINKPLLACGHLHAICPSGTYQGYAACDKEPWGAYMVGAMYALATSKNYPDDSRESRIMDAVFKDNADRLISVSADDIKTVVPDMSSKDD